MVNGSGGAVSFQTRYEVESGGGGARHVFFFFFSVPEMPLGIRRFAGAVSRSLSLGLNSEWKKAKEKQRRGLSLRV